MPPPAPRPPARSAPPAPSAPPARSALEPLPIDRVMGEVMAALADRGAVVLRAPTGAGKTTRVPPAILDAGLAGHRKVVMLEPRRVAARAAARRIAAERGGTVGGEVGFRIRFERRESAATRILVVTEGVLLAMLQADPFLDEVGAIVFDELHERSLDADLALAMARRVRREARADLRLVAMSATLVAAPIAAFLGDAPIVESGGRLHPVRLAFLDRPDPRPLPEQIAAGVKRVAAESTGQVLAFLPGVGEIRRTADLLAPWARERGLTIAPLYGDLPSAEQDAALAPGAGRKVVLATNVAESSVTVDGVEAVVDCGLARVLRYDPATGLDGLELTRISRSSADQRAGRAGRQRPGLCLRLWTELDDRTLVADDLPEVRRVDLAPAVLQLLAWGEADPAAFEWLEPPSAEALTRARHLLADLGATVDGRLAELGRAMARLPLHPRLARLVVAGHRLGTLGRATLAAAILAERDLVRRDRTAGAAAYGGSSDVLDRVLALERFATSGWGETASGPLDRGRAHRALQAAAQIERHARRALGAEPVHEDGDDEEARLLRAVLAAYPDRVARRRGDDGIAGQRAVLVGGRGVAVAPSSVVRDAELFVAVELDAGHGRTDAWVRQASAIAADWLPADQLVTREDVELDGERQRVVGRRRTLYRDLVLAEVEVPATPAAAAGVLVAAAGRDLAAALPLDDPPVADFLARLRSLVGWMPELGLPVFDDDELRSLLPALAAGARSFAELRRAPLLDVLRGSLGHHRLGELERHAPERLTVPSGSQIRLRYEPGKPPILAARIQELFGWTDTPRIAGGRIPVLLHLLAPNQRPQQVTQDLASFWRNTYPQIRKELAGRYPKHAWPTDPLTAPPERRPRRRPHG